MSSNKMLAKKLRTKTSEELKAELLSLMHEKFKLRLQASTNENQQTHEIKSVRRNIARVKTVMAEVDHD